MEQLLESTKGATHILELPKHRPPVRGRFVGNSVSRNKGNPARHFFLWELRQDKRATQERDGRFMSVKEIKTTINHSIMSLLSISSGVGSGVGS